MRRSALALIVAVIAGVAVFGAAASLGVSSKKVDAFGSGQAATTSSSTSSTTTTANAAPALTTLEMFDIDTDGKVDRVVATFNEPLAAYTAGNAPWTLSNVPSGGSLNSVSVTTGGTAATLTLNEGAGAANTAVGTFTVALAASSAGIRDSGGAQSSFAATAPVDKARPVVNTLVIANGGATTGRPEMSDTLTVTWSERLAESSICAGFDDVDTVTIDGNSGAAQIRIKDHAAAPATTHDVLDATFSCGLNFGSVSLGSSAYMTATRTFAANASADRSSATWNPSARTFELKLGATTSGGVGTVGSSSAVYDPDDDLSDPSGNAVSSTYTYTTANVSQF